MLLECIQVVPGPVCTEENPLFVHPFAMGSQPCLMGYTKYLKECIWEERLRQEKIKRAEQKVIREELKRPIQKQLGEKHERPLQIKEELREALEMLKQEQLREEQEKQRLEQLKEEEKEAEKQKLDLRLKIDHNVSAMTCSIPDAEAVMRP